MPLTPFDLKLMQCSNPAIIDSLCLDGRGKLQDWEIQIILDFIWYQNKNLESNLKWLDIRDCEFCPFSYLQLTAAYNQMPNIQIFRISSNGSTDPMVLRKAGVWVSSFQNLICGLENMQDLRDISIPLYRWSLTEVEIFTKVLSRSTKLIQLSLDHSLLTFRRAIAVFSALSHLKNLRLLNLCYNKFEDDDVSILAKSLQSMQQLRFLILSNNGIGPNGVRYLFRGLRSLKKLLYIDLSDNQLTYKGAAILSSFLQFMPRLKVLKLDKNDIGTEGTSVLLNGLIDRFSVDSFAYEELKRIVRKIHCSDNKHIISNNNNNNNYVIKKPPQVWRRIPIEVWEIILDYLPRGGRIEVLSLKANNIGSHLEKDEDGSLFLCPTDISIQLLRLPCLREVYLQHNRLTCMNVRVFMLPAMQVCRIQNNPKLFQPPVSLSQLSLEGVKNYILNHFEEDENLELYQIQKPKEINVEEQKVPVIKSYTLSQFCYSKVSSAMKICLSVYIAFAVSHGKDLSFVLSTRVNAVSYRQATADENLCYLAVMGGLLCITIGCSIDIFCQPR